MSARKLHRSLTRAVVNAHAAAAHSTVTIAARLPVLTGCLVAPNASALAEWNQAYTEKVEAVWEGALAASLEWHSLLLRSALQAPTPVAFANDMMQVVHKAGHPARRRVKANAKRLGTPKG